MDPNVRGHFFLIFVVTEAIVFTALAAYVVGRRPRRTSSWVLAAICLGISALYVTGLFLLPGDRPIATSSPSPLALRIRWTVVSLSPALNLHLASFYFRPSWLPRCRSAYRLLYGLGLLCALAALRSDWLIAGPMYRGPNTVLGAQPGPLMPLLLISSTASTVASLAGIILSARAAPLHVMQRQARFLLLPFSLLFAAALVNWAAGLSYMRFPLSYEIGNVLLLLMGLSFAYAVLRHGSYVDRPVSRRHLFYTTLTTTAGILFILLSLRIDGWLAQQTPLPFPLATTVMLVAALIGHPALRAAIVEPLDRRFFWEEKQRQELAQHLAVALTDVPDPAQLPKALLDTLCGLLGSRGGFIALAENAVTVDTVAQTNVTADALAQTNGEAPTATVHYVYGETRARLHEILPLPPVPVNGAELANTLPNPLHAAPAWQDIVVLCPLRVNNTYYGVMAIGEKTNGACFTNQELELCADVANRIGAVEKMLQLRREQAELLQSAGSNGERLQTTGRRVPKVETAAGAAPIEIRVLGQLEVRRNGEPIPAADWTTEKAKGLLAYLLWKGEIGATREELSSLLWPERDGDDTANVFHVTLHHLRRVLEPERQRGSRYVLHRQGYYIFNSRASYRLDVAEFEQLALRSDTASLQSAVTLYRGGYLEDMAWALPPEAEGERRRLEELYVHVLQQLIAQTGGREAEPYLHRLLHVEPVDETARRALVSNYLQRGRRDLALQQIQHWQQILDELGFSPSPEVASFWREVRLQSG